MKHTNGRWVVDKEIPTRVLCDNGTIHIDVRHYDHKAEEAEANAKLIAAAPELLKLAIAADKMIEGHFNGKELTVGNWKEIADRAYAIKRATE